nr:protein ELYS [Onthophagus taurus]
MSENCVLRKSVPLGTFAQSYLTETEKRENVPPDATFGGILSDNKYAWYVNGSRLQVVDVRRGKTIAGWCFGSIVKDSTTKVVCIAEIPILSRETPVLVVGLEYLSTGGTICVFDVLTSKVVRALQLKEKISSLHVIDGGKDLLPLQGPLRSFDGVIGVGCVGGGILLIDLCRHSIEEEQDRDEVDTCRIEELTCKDLPHLEYHKQKLRSGVHLAINLNSSTNYINKHRRGPDMAITSLCYCPQLASLIVGYSFGAWQLWELLTMKCVYTSPTYDKNIPVSHFAIQEPSDDPKPVCYIWAIYSCYKEILTTYPLAVLYSVNYTIKEFHDGYGVLYQDFESCMVRYQMELGFNSSNKTSPETNILRLTTYKSNGSKLPSPDNPEDSLSICYMAWNIYGTDGVQSYIGLFDLNQWYKAQMPAYTDNDSANYLSVVCVTDLIGNSDFVLDVTIDEGSVKQFLGVQKPEEHYYTSALSYEITCCEEKVTHFICHRGQQRTLLKSIEESDSLIFLKPQEICKTAQKFGLTPIFLDSSYSSINNAPGKFLLSLALEHQMIGWLCKCAKIWSNGRFKSSGYPLEYFLDWAWNRASELKANADSLTVPLFDYSETIIDANNQRIMNVCINQLKNLVTIYEFILNQLEEYILHKDIIHQQHSSLQMVVTHFEVIQWMVNSGLLPECKDTFLYPIETFISYYNTRRLEIQNAHYEQFSSKESLLFIDILLKTEFSDMQLQECWKEDEGNGFYPPPSMQSLLRTYLIDNVNFSLKHTVLIYAFLDLSMALDKSRNTFIITQLIKFPTIFRVNPSVTALSQAFWHLDHKDFTSALDLLLDPAISNSDIKLWHHRVIISALLIQKQYNLALTYYQIRKPPLKEVDDIIKLISLFVKNDMIHEAIEFQREHVNRENQETILTHLYRECNSVKQLKKILRYALTETEERVIMKYLKDVSHPQQEELEVMYYVKRFRYTDIMKTATREEQSVAVPSGLQGQKMISYKESFAKRLAGFFPKISTDLFKVCQNQKEVFQNKVISRPQPLSVVIHGTDQQAKYKSNLIQMSMVKARETWKKPIDGETHGSENCPFVRTPLTLISSSRKRSLICPKIIKVDGNVDEENIESPCKKQKLQPRQSISSVSLKNSFNDSNLSNISATKLNTPLIKRKVKRLSGQSLEGSENLAICTPQSILKVRNLIHSSTAQESQSPSTSKIIASNLSLGLTPRKPTSRLTVHFESSTNESRSIEPLEQISDFMNISAISKQDRFSDSKTHENKIDESVDNNKIDESKEIKDPSSDDVFYSPDSSLEEDLQPPEEKTMDLETTISSPIKNQIKGRNSYKDKTPEKIYETLTKEPIEKPKTHKENSIYEENSAIELEKTTKEESTSNITKSPVKSPRSAKPRLRKSLSRMVLENNALSTLSPTVKRSVRYSLNSPKSKTSLSSILGEGDFSGSSNQSVEKDKLEEPSITELNVSKNSSSQSDYNLRGRLQKRRSVSSSKRSSLQSISSSFGSKEIISLNSTEQSITQDQQMVHEDISVEQEKESKQEEIEKSADLSKTPDSIIEWIEKIKATATVSRCSSFDNTKYNEIISSDTVDKSVTEEPIDSLMNASENKDESVYEWIENVRVTMVPSRFSVFNSTKHDEIFSYDTTTEKSLLQDQKESNQESSKINEIEEEKADAVEEQKMEDVQTVKPIQEEIFVADETVDVNTGIEQDVEMEVEIEEEMTQNVQEIIELSDPTINDESINEVPIEIASKSHQIEIDQDLTSVSNEKDKTINKGFIASKNVIETSTLVPIEISAVDEQLSEIDHIKHSPEIITGQNLTSVSNESDKTVNKAFIASTNVIEISDSSTDESLTEPSSTDDNDDLNKAMIDSDETTRKPVHSNPPSDKSTIGSSSEDSFESNTSFKWDYESSRDERQEETVENVQQIETEVGEIETEMVDQGVQVTIIQEDVVEEDGIVDNWVMEEEVRSEQEPFLTILVTEENEVNLELTQNTNDELESCKVEDDQIKEEMKDVENAIESTEMSNEIKQDSIQIQDDVEKNIQDKQEIQQEINPIQIEENIQEKTVKIKKKSSKVSKIEEAQNIEDTNVSEEKSKPTSSNTDVSLKKIQDSIDISKKNPRVILHDVTKSWTPEMRAIRGMSIDREIPKDEEEIEPPKTPSRRLSRSVSVDPDTPVRKSRRLAGLGLPEETNITDEPLQTVSVRTRRSSMSKLGHNNENVPDKKETLTKKLKKGSEKELKKETKGEEEVVKAPQRRNKRSKSDCDIEVEVKMPVKRNTRSNSMSSTSVLPTVPENVAIPSTSLRRSSRSRSKTPDKTVLETSTRSLRKGSLAQIPEEPEMASAQEQKVKKSRPRKGSTK